MTTAYMPYSLCASDSRARHERPLVVRDLRARAGTQAPPRRPLDRGTCCERRGRPAPRRRRRSRRSSRSRVSRTSRTAGRSSTSSACIGAIAAASRRSSSGRRARTSSRPRAPPTSPADGAHTRTRDDQLDLARDVGRRLEGIRKTKEIGFDTYDIFEDPLMISTSRAAGDQATCAEVGLPIRSAVCVAFGLVDFKPAVQQFTLDRIKAYIDQRRYFGGAQRAARGRRVLLGLRGVPGRPIFGHMAEDVRESAEYARAEGPRARDRARAVRRTRCSRTSTSSRASIREVDHPAVQANADVSHLHLSGASFEDVADARRG